MTGINTHNHLEVVEDLIASANFSKEVIERVFHGEIDISDIEIFTSAQLNAYEAFIELKNSEQLKVQSFFRDINFESDEKIDQESLLQGKLPRIK